MSIIVVCPGCKKSFKVSDKYAGKSGACPNPDCKATIKVPRKEEEVKVHAPTEFADGGRGVTGKLATKPIARKEAKLSPVVAVAIGGGALTVVLVTWVAGDLIRGNLAVRALGLLLISPPLAVAAYSFLRDDELEPYQGTALYVRSAICALGYVVLWGVYSRLAVRLSGDLWEWFFVVPPFLVAGALIALVCLDLDFGSSFFHYSFYLLVTVLLGWVAGIRWVWEAANTMAP
ncbi:MAG: hypothetical protein ACYSWU_07625 [Planctomycetota bacterium]|jgi:hypothetical protein